MATQRQFDSRKAVVMERLLRAWEKQPDDTLGQLLYAACDFSGREINSLSDEDACDAVERFVLLGMPPVVEEDTIPDPPTGKRRISQELKAMCYHKKLKHECNICKEK